MHCIKLCHKQHIIFHFSPVFNHSNDTHPTDKLLIIQCDSGHLYGDLVACARYRVDDEREKALLHKRSHHGVTHVLFIVSLPRKEIDTSRSGSKMVGFQGGAWISAHIDDIRKSCKEELTLEEARSAPIHKLFYNMKFISSAPVITNTEVHMSLEEEEKVTPVDEGDMEVEYIELHVIDEEMKEDGGSIPETPMEVDDDKGGILMELADQQYDEEVFQLQIYLLLIFLLFFNSTHQWK